MSDPRRRWWERRWAQVLIALAVVALFFKLYAGWNWHVQRRAGRGVTFSPTRAYIAHSSAYALLMDAIAPYTNLRSRLDTIIPYALWRGSFVLLTVGPAALIAVCTFAKLSKCYRKGRDDGESHCRRCGYILRGLSEPRCSECGEWI
ncbi:MAG TPA: hypothetical protein VJZ71_12935 [Phycisphaerae bacterium]|nr:hypothetical protein [Phycisphaerae bacterium]